MGNNLAQEGGASYDVKKGFLQSKKNQKKYRIFKKKGTDRKPF
jgi:hypothetical protein